MREMMRVYSSRYTCELVLIYEEKNYIIKRKNKQNKTTMWRRRKRRKIGKSCSRHYVISPPSLCISAAYSVIIIRIPSAGCCRRAIASSRRRAHIIHNCGLLLLLGISLIIPSSLYFSDTARKYFRKNRFPEKMFFTRQGVCLFSVSTSCLYIYYRFYCC